MQSLPPNHPEVAPVGVLDSKGKTTEIIKLSQLCSKLPKRGPECSIYYFSCLHDGTKINTSRQHTFHLPYSSIYNVMTRKLRELGTSETGVVWYVWMRGRWGVMGVYGLGGRHEAQAPSHLVKNYNETYR
jgi:hypothetical protein